MTVARGYRKNSEFIFYTQRYSTESNEFNCFDLFLFSSSFYEYFFILSVVFNWFFGGEQWRLAVGIWVWCNEVGLDRSGERTMMDLWCFVGDDAATAVGRKVKGEGSPADVEMVSAVIVKPALKMAWVLAKLRSLCGGTVVVMFIAKL